MALRRRLVMTGAIGEFVLTVESDLGRIVDGRPESRTVRRFTVERADLMPFADGEVSLPDLSELSAEDLERLAELVREAARMLDALHGNEGW